MYKTLFHHPRFLVVSMSFAAAVIGASACTTGDDTPSLHGDASADAPPGNGDGGTPSAEAAADAEASAASIHVQILAFNDFHGNLRPPSPSNAQVLVPPNDPVIGDAGSVTLTDAGVLDGGPLNVQVSAGGAAYFAAHLKQLRAQNPNTLVVSAGDLTGASPLVSSTYDDEPTIQVMNAMGLDYHSVGNHEFDKGPSELLRKQFGGCNAFDRTDAGGSCFADPTFPGATFTYLAANVDTNASTTKTLFPAYEVAIVGGAKIAIVGMTLKGTPAIVSPSGTAGLTFGDEVATVNALVPALKRQNVDSIVVLLHQGGFQQGTYDECAGFSGGTVATGTEDIGAIVDMLDPAVDVVASAHTHQAYNCTRSGKLLTSAASYGRIITQIDLSIDGRAHKVTGKSAKNVVVTRDVAPDPVVGAMVDKYVALVRPVAERPVGQISADILNRAGASGEAPLGDVVTDAMLSVASSMTLPTGVAAPSVAFTNIGGLRDSLSFKEYYSEGDGVVTFEKAQAVLPFGNVVELATCTGQQIVDVVQQNVFVQAGSPKVLQTSGLTYAWATTAANAMGQGAADPASFAIGGVALDPLATYTVVLTDFIGSGGDGYTGFSKCSIVTGADQKPFRVGVDLSVFTQYLGIPANRPLPAPTSTRITKTN